ncbi:RING finger protein 141-like isoform X1 [Ischnura elegans]|uniref:RING finger protein 141-like isoform X1 n=1 Tax=Ischnura elegans TaxID=197161 RepID=UPI001ED89D02|nr:RING finger protein 141-like isoform X1 [Ischnura elegans]
MGQSSSYDSLIPQSVDNLQKEICRHARAFTEVASLSYDDFQNCLGELNLLSDQCVDSNGKKLVFAIKKGTDSTVLWKGTVRIACVKMDASTKKVESYRLLTLSQFLRVVKTLECQIEACWQSSQGKSPSHKGSLMIIPRELSAATHSKGYADSEYLKNASALPQHNCNRKAHPISASLLMEQLEEVTHEEGIAVAAGGTECCICLERQPDVLLPCTHSYCQHCIELWNVDHKTCPVCRETFESTDDTWVVISEAPGSDEIGKEIRTSLMNLASSSSSSSSTSNLP